MALDTLWEASFPDRPRPYLYTSGKAADDGWLPLTDADSFLVDSLSSLTSAQLYSLTANNAEALRAAQSEWTELERLAQWLKTHDPFSTTHKDPQELPRREIFEERKEASLYSYKYDGHRRMLTARYTIAENVTDQEKFDCREPPEPFSQGGFIPNDKQYRTLMNAAKADGREKNPDNQKPYETNFSFDGRPPGTWIAKVMPPEAAPPPRTRSREAALAQVVPVTDRATRFNGEKVPATRDVSLGPSTVPSPRSTIATPNVSASPLPQKRKVDAVDVAPVLVKKTKHPNQYTKRRLLLAQEEARLKGLPIPETVEDIKYPTPSPPGPMRKKQPNQWTKRRDREEAERKAREEAERLQREGVAPIINGVRSGGDPFYQAGPPPHAGPYHLPQYGAPPNMDVPTPPQERKKHANQYTKRREREEAERLANMQYANAPAGAFGTSRNGTPSALAHIQAHAYGQPYPNHHPYPPSDLSRSVTPYHQPYPPQPSYLRGPPPHPHQLPSTQQPSGPLPPQQHAPPAGPTIHPFPHLSTIELRSRNYKDHELVGLLHHDHSWLHDDLEMAAQWKAKILSSDYPVRTWAMLKKWKEWRHVGKDKRPRDKDGNRIKDVEVNGVVEANAVNSARPSALNGDEDIQMVDADALPVANSINANGNALAGSSFESNGQAASISAPSSAYPAERSPSARAQSPLHVNRPTRLRIRALGVGSPAPTSPLVNGVNARDIEVVESPNLSFTSKLQRMDSQDATSKVNGWQVQEQLRDRSPPPLPRPYGRLIRDDMPTEYAATTTAGKGALRHAPRQTFQGTEDEMYPTSNSAISPRGGSASAALGYERSVEAIQEEHASVQAESDDPLHRDDGESQQDGDEDRSESDSESDRTDPGERDTSYRSGVRQSRYARPTRNTRPTRKSRANRAAPMSAALVNGNIQRSGTRSSRSRAQHVEVDTSAPVNGRPSRSRPNRNRAALHDEEIDVEIDVDEAPAPAPNPASAPRNRPSRTRNTATRNQITNDVTQIDTKDTSPSTSSPALARPSRTRSTNEAAPPNPNRERTESPLVGRRSLRPNPPRRTLTMENEVFTDDDEHDDADALEDDDHTADQQFTAPSTSPNVGKRSLRSNPPKRRLTDTKNSAWEAFVAMGVAATARARVERLRIAEEYRRRGTFKAD